MIRRNSSPEQIDVAALLFVTQQSLITWRQQIGVFLVGVCCNILTLLLGLKGILLYSVTIDTFLSFSYRKYGGNYIRKKLQVIATSLVAQLYNQNTL